MVSFSCEVCSDILKKPKLDSHAARCHGAHYTCIDCSKTFMEGQWKGHTSCISEAEKYQGSSYKREKGKGKKGEKGKENDAAATDAIVTTTVPAVKAKRDKKGSPETIATPTADSPPAESPDLPNPSKKEKKKSKKVKKDKKDKRSEDTPTIWETGPGSAPAAEAVDNGGKRKNASAEDTLAKKKKKRGGDEKKAKSSQEKLAELVVGEEELRLETFLERLEEAAGGGYDKVIEGVAFQGLRVKADGGKAVLLFNW